MDDYTGERIPPSGGGFIKYLLGFITTVGIVGALSAVAWFFLTYPNAILWFLMACGIAMCTFFVANILFGD